MRLVVWKMDATLDAATDDCTVLVDYQLITVQAGFDSTYLTALSVSTDCHRQTWDFL